LRFEFGVHCSKRGSLSPILHGGFPDGEILPQLQLPTWTEEIKAYIDRDRQCNGVYISKYSNLTSREKRSEN